MATYARKCLPEAFSVDMQRCKKPVNITATKLPMSGGGTKELSSFFSIVILFMRVAINFEKYNCISADWFA